MLVKRAQHILLTSLLPNMSAAVYMFELSLHVPVSIFLLYLLFWTDYWALVLLSAFWAYYDKDTPARGGRQSWLVKHSPLWRYLREYFPATLVKTADLDPGKNYIFCTHPHGFMCTGNIVHFVTGYSMADKLFPGLKFHTATLNLNFCIPLLRDYVLAYGFVHASRASLEYLLNDKQKGNVVNLIVGGSAEATYSKRGEYRIVLKRRKGFVRIALSIGCSLVPVFCFGENDLFDLHFPSGDCLLAKMLEWFKKLTGVSLCFPAGRSGLFKLLPRRSPLGTVVGKPIEIPKVSEPTQEEIDHYHGLYTEALMRLFNEHKHKYVPDPENTDLIIVE